MEERFNKLEAFLDNEQEAAKVFALPLNEAAAKLAELGMDFTAEELQQIIDGAKSTMEKDAELDEASLEAVAGGCKDCNSFGRKVGEKIGKILRCIAFWR